MDNMNTGLKHKHIVEQMTLSEKCGLLSGRNMWSTKPVERLGIRSLFLADGPTGVRKQIDEGDHLGMNESLPATCWPTASALACSWDPELCEKVGGLLGKEAVSQGVDVVLGPGLNIKRSPICGRNFEYFSEDPYLSGKLAAGFIRGIQGNGIAACAKHFAANSQELNRMNCDSVVDERTLREIYLTNFEIAVKEGRPKAIMTSYNKVNGAYANENEHLLRDILAGEWGFTGVVMSDWGGSNDHVEGVRAGSHLEMPGTHGDSERQLEQAVREGRISEELIDQRVDELLDLVFSLRMPGCDRIPGNNQLPENDQRSGHIHHPAKDSHSRPDRFSGDHMITTFDIDYHHEMAEKAAEQTIVLLKNESRILPLKKGARVAVVGDFAADPRFQGAGSSLVNPTRLESTLDVIGRFELELIGYAPGFRRNGKRDARLENEAVELVKRAEVVLLYMGLPEIFETEGMDREHMRLPDNQVALLHELADVNKNIVIILSAGSPVEMPWIDDCAALVWGGLGGQAAAAALLKVITGQVNPSGRLAETIPLRYEDMPVSAYYPGLQYSAEYREGLYVGYRYFETVGREVLFPFGFGLSYTTFEYSDLAVTEQQVSLTLKNTGEMAGAEVVQVYIGCPDGKVFRPAKELKGFAKVYLEPGENRTVTIPLDDKAFRYFNVKTGRWETESAMYKVMAGPNVRDIRLTGTIGIKGTDAPCPYDPAAIPSYYSGHVENVSQAEFETLLGHPVPESAWDTKRPLGMNDALCQMYYAKSRLARLAYRVLTRVKYRSIASGKPDLDILCVYHMPFRGLAKLSGGIITMDMARALLVIVNGHFIKGLRQLARAYFAARKAKKQLRTTDGGTTGEAGVSV